MLCYVLVCQEAEQWVDRYSRLATRNVRLTFIIVNSAVVDVRREHFMLFRGVFYEHILEQKEMFILVYN